MFQNIKFTSFKYSNPGDISYEEYTAIKLRTMVRKKNCNQEVKGKAQTWVKSTNKPTFRVEKVKLGVTFDTTPSRQRNDRSFLTLRWQWQGKRRHEKYDKSNIITQMTRKLEHFEHEENPSQRGEKRGWPPLLCRDQKRVTGSSSEFSKREKPISQKFASTHHRIFRLVRRVWPCKRYPLCPPWPMG